MSQPKEIFLKDYQEPNYWMTHIDLTFDIHEGVTRVTALSTVKKGRTGSPNELFLSGEELKLKSVEVNDEPANYEIVDGGLLLKNLPDEFDLRIENEIVPEENKALEGLYKTASGFYCTQCEAEGFRRITYFNDRPDNMAFYKTTIIADKKNYPILLSNGNPVEQKELEGGRHLAKWEDPFPKPSYLFALVAGDLDEVHDSFKTQSGRDVALSIYTDKGRSDRTAWAMECLKQSMVWDEKRYGLEYDLDRYMIVAVDDFNMGAMENKGLNIFNSRCVLADERSATDYDFNRIEGIIGHEYFHNWTGNRVTCRDWFQLSLKEGLTVYRDQEFTSDLNSATVKRIEDVSTLRSGQFAEDAGPNAHPIRPQSAISVDNFYTYTVYRKGAEVIRMIDVLVGKEGFRKGMDLYFERYDGKAVTTEDFVAAMADANSIDLTQFKNWYDQAGTPLVKASGQWDSKRQIYTLTMEQSCRPTPKQPEKKPFHIPVKLGFVSKSGEELKFCFEGGKPVVETVVSLTQMQQSFEFAVDAEPIPSLFRDFSAPVNVEFSYSDQELFQLMGSDANRFNRWNAGQTLLKNYLLSMIEGTTAESEWDLPEDFVKALEKNLQGWQEDPAFTDAMFVIPDRSYLEQFVAEIHPDRIEAARKFVRKTIAEALEETLVEVYRSADGAGIDPRSKSAIALRGLRSQVLTYLTRLEKNEYVEWAYELYQQQRNMSEAVTALSALGWGVNNRWKEASEDFYSKWKEDTVVFNKWLAANAVRDDHACFEWLKELKNEAHFDIFNPNNVYSSYLIFADTSERFHHSSGDAYEFLTDRILELDPKNPQVAAGLLESFSQWKKYEPVRRELQKKQLERIMAVENLSKNSFEIASRALNS